MFLQDDLYDFFSKLKHGKDFAQPMSSQLGQAKEHPKPTPFCSIAVFRRFLKLMAGNGTGTVRCSKRGNVIQNSQLAR